VEIVLECLDLMDKGIGKILSSEACIDQDIERGAVLIKTTFGMAICLEDEGHYTIKIASANVKNQLPEKQTPTFNFYGVVGEYPKAYTLNHEIYSGMAVIVGLEGRQLVIHITKN